MSRMFPRMDAYIAPAGRGRIAVDERTVTGAPEALKGLRTVFVSDVHMRPGMDAEPLVRRIMDAQPDLILLGGDYADRKEDALRLFDAFRALRAPRGIFAARGNNDAEAFESAEELADAVSLFGARLLVDECADGGGFLIGAVNEYRHSRSEYGKVFAGKAGYKILLSHYPVLPKDGEKPDLMLCGHTHGGQFNALGLTPYGIGFERMGGMSHLAPEMVSGFDTVEGVKMLVSKGIGTSRIHWRIGVEPQIHLLHFEC